MPSSHETTRPAPTPPLVRIENQSILTPTGGYLKPGFTHTINPYVGCSFAGALCGVFCYVQHSPWITRGRPWGLYGAKQNLRQAYRRDHDRLRKGSGDSSRLAIFMSSATDPYLPQEARLRLTRSLIEEMVQRPPDALVLQSHHILMERDQDLLAELSTKARVWASITVETDMDRIPGFPPHACSPARRIETLGRLRDAGILTQATLSPLLPIRDAATFARQLDQSCDRVILDHYLIGDGSPGGQRTLRTTLVNRLTHAGFQAWTSLDMLWRIRDLMTDVLGHQRVLVGRQGFSTL